MGKGIRAGVCLGFGLIGLLSCGGEKDEKDVNPPGTNLHSNEQQRVKVSVIGDSISTGVLAETQFAKTPDRNLFVKIIRFWLEDGDEANLEAEFSRPDLAAATTTEDYGFRTTVANIEGMKVEDVEYFSAAKFGGKTSDIDSMLENLSQQQAASSQEGGSSYVLFMLGANDFCADRTQEEFSQSLQAALRKTVDRYRQSTILVAYLPPVHQLSQFDHEYTARLPGGGDYGVVSCRDFQKNSCQAIFADNAEERYQQFNEAIRQGVATVKEENENLQMMTAESMLTWDLKDTELAADCFHPSSAGQRRIGGFFQEDLKP
ncbi:MAG: SGNH/GDSL hydrolase family protein [Oligoflexus sp.]